MGKRAAGDRPVPYSVYADRGIAHLNTRLAGVRHRPSLGIPYDPHTASARDVRAVEKAAAEKYAALVSGRVVDPSPESRVLTSLTLDELGGLWLLEAKKLWPKSFKTRVIQLRNATSWAEGAARFEKDPRTPLERLVDESGPSQYAADRLQQVLKDTLQKELAPLFQFFSWAVRERFLRSCPPRPEIPRSAHGTRSGTQREEPVDVTNVEALAICEAAPEWAVRGGRGIREGHTLPPKAFRVRDRMRFCYEMALRPGDVSQFEVPRHWTRGQPYLSLKADTDKTGFTGRMPLTQVALEILERCAPESGPIFGRHDIRNHIKAAALAVLSPERAKGFAAYDFRHARAVHSLEVTGDLLGTSRMLRHSQLTTTNRYVRSREAHVESVVNALDMVSRRSAGLIPDESEGSSSEEKAMSDHNVVRRRGLEPLRFYPLAPQRLSFEEIPRCSAGDDRLCTSGNAEQRQVHDTPGSASGQHVPRALTDVARALAFERTLWDAFDTFALHDLGIEVDS